MNYLEFEKPLAEIEGKAEELRAMGRANPGMDVEKEAAGLDKKASDMIVALYGSLTAWQKCQVARHPERPHCKEYIETLFSEYTPLAGDRNFADDHSVMGGLARFDGQAVMVIGHEKGNDTTSRVKHNFGMGRPEGYRKAIRLIELAGRFNVPIVTLVDTAGAFPGLDAEERGQAEAIARATEACLAAPVPIIAAITGEGGSGGAVALAAADKVIMFEHAIYAVISPEGCASILWRTADKTQGGANSHAPEAAEAMRVTAADLKKLGVIDVIVSEPLGGAHRDPAAAIAALNMAIATELSPLLTMAPAALRKARRNKFVEMGRLL
jgi:acetyl-CoA carboxylase carboxyl transferase subunit alpha